MAEPRYLLDTNIIIYVLEHSGSAVVRRLEACRVGEAVTSAIVYAEVMIGALRVDHAPSPGAIFDVIGVMPFDRPAAETYARLPFRRGGYDRLIAAHALALGLTLVTNNERDFAGIEGLRTENWAA